MLQVLEEMVYFWSQIPICYKDKAIHAKEVQAREKKSLTLFSAEFV